MKLSIALLATTLAVAEASSDSAASGLAATLRRRLSYAAIAGYLPGSQVTDHCAIDLDQKAIEDQLTQKTPEAFQNARKIYNNGGHSKSYALITLTDTLKSNIKKSDPISGTNSEGNSVSGKAYADYDKGTTGAIKVLYATTDLQASYVDCQVGALTEPNMSGCFAATGVLKIDEEEHAYTYDPEMNNVNDRTIAKFSTGAGAKMSGYTDYKYFKDYYGEEDYAHQWVEAAFEGDSTSFSNGNADFSRYDFEGKEQAIKKGAAYLNIFMYVIREWEDAVEDCEIGSIDENYASVHAWDEGVCFYTGSIEGVDGLTGDGKLLHQLADKRCENFKTCGESGTDLAGPAMVNHKLGGLFALGNHQLLSGECATARGTVKKVITQMYIPMIQGTLRYAYKVDKLQGGETEKAEGATFAAAVLPRVHAASPAAASIIYDNMRVGAPTTDFKAVKKAFESVYADIGVSCTDIGGLWFEGDDTYYPGMEPCGAGTASTQSENASYRLGLGAFSSFCLSMVVYFSL
mmetsp:Transcript_37819/g.61789  ORF Transcript_37819/g.61789 Transcript_37819/m.61789 type:complete len:518 (+) Transcript_37819:133-1686(+)